MMGGVPVKDGSGLPGENAADPGLPKAFHENLPHQHPELTR